MVYTLFSRTREK